MSLSPVVPLALSPILQHTFASFLSRDTTYDLIGNIWRMVHPVVPMSAALPDALTTTTSRDLESDDEGIVSASGVEAAAPSEGIHTRAKRRLKGFRRPRGGTGESSVGGGGAKAASSVDGGEAGAAGEDGVADGGAGGDAAAGEGATKGKKAAKAAPHPPTVDTCATLKNLKEVCMDSTFPGAPEKLYNLMFTSGFMKGFWAENQKLTGASVSSEQRLLVQCRVLIANWVRRDPDRRLGAASVRLEPPRAVHVVHQAAQRLDRAQADQVPHHGRVSARRL